MSKLSFWHNNFNFNPLNFVYVLLNHNHKQKTTRDLKKKEKKWGKKGEKKWQEIEKHLWANIIYSEQYQATEIKIK